MWTTAGEPSAPGGLFGQPQVVEAGPSQHLAVGGIHEVQAVLVDDLDLHALPLLPASGADLTQNALLQGGREGHAGGGGRLAGLAAAEARDGHSRSVKTLII